MDPNGTNRNPRKRKRRVKRRVKIPVIGLAVVGVLLILAQILAGTVARPILERRTSDMLGAHPFASSRCQ